MKLRPALSRRFDDDDDLAADACGLPGFACVPFALHAADPERERAHEGALRDVQASGVDIFAKPSWLS